MKKTTPNSNYLTVAEVSRYLNISQSKAYELVHRRDFPVCRFDSLIRVPNDLFIKWVEKHTHAPASLVV